MTSRCHPSALVLVALAIGLASACSRAESDLPRRGEEAAPAARRLDVDPPDWFVASSDPDTPRRFSAKAPTLSGPSVVAGEPPGINVGDYAPDFELEPVELYPEFKELLGDRSPKSFADRVQLSDLMGGRPVMLIFGSYT